MRRDHPTWCWPCNLTEVVIRAGDTLDMLKEKVEVATIMGNKYQSTLTNFRYVRPVWRKTQRTNACSACP